MAIIEINVVSGNIPVKADLKAAVGLGQNNIKRYEVDGSKVMYSAKIIKRCYLFKLRVCEYICALIYFDGF